MLMRFFFLYFAVSFPQIFGRASLHFLGSQVINLLEREKAFANKKATTIASSLFFLCVAFSFSSSYVCSFFFKELL